MLIRERLEQESFSAAQKVVVDWILDHTEELENLTVRQISKRAYCSSATLVRIAQKLGYSGWEEFKADYLKEQEYLAFSFSDVDANIPFEKDDSLLVISARLARLEMEAINDTASLVDVEELRRAVNLIEKAGTVNILATNNTKCLAELFAVKLGRLHKLALVPDIAGEGIYNGTLSRKDSCTIVLSYSGDTRNLVRACTLAKRAGRPIIAITSIGESAISRMADVVLKICTREKMVSKIGWFTTETAFSYVLDVLYAGLFARDYDRNLELRIKTAKAIEAHRTAAAQIMEEE